MSEFGRELKKYEDKLWDCATPEVGNFVSNDEKEEARHRLIEAHIADSLKTTKRYAEDFKETHNECLEALGYIKSLHKHEKNSPVFIKAEKAFEKLSRTIELHKDKNNE